jgi:hypothetical protein
VPWHTLLEANVHRLLQLAAIRTPRLIRIGPSMRRNDGLVLVLNTVALDIDTTARMQM